MSSMTNDQGDAVRAALAEQLGTTEIDIISEVAARLPSGEEVWLVHATVRGQPNQTASLAVDASGAVHSPRHFEALAGRDLFAPEMHVPELPTTPPPQPVTINPAANDLTLPECVTEDETITVHVPVSGVPPKADIYLLADTTASMGPIITTVQAGIDTVLNMPFFGDIAWGVGNYKDFPVPAPNPYAFEPQLSLTPGAAGVAAAKLAVTAWSASDGSDIPEGQLFALQQIATDPAIGWRPGSKRILVWFGDAPGHDPICQAISGVPDITETTATAALLTNPPITVVAISTDTGTAGALDGDPTAGSTDYGVCTVGGSPGQATRIAGATPGGSHTSGVNTATIIATLTSLISSAVQAIGHLELQPTGAIAQFVTSITPSGYDSLPGDVEHTLPFDVTWTGVQDCTDKDQVLTGSIDVVADGVVVASKPVKITVPACRWHYSVEMICGTQKGSEGHDPCQTVVDGRYATAVTIYNPSTCVVRLVKYFAPLVLHGAPVGREPKKVGARPFARLELAPREATLEDCCALEAAVGPTPPGNPLVLGVLDIVADHALEVTATHTANGAGPAATSITARTIKPRRA
jgi:hypothetical protein